MGIELDPGSHQLEFYFVVFSSEIDRKDLAVQMRKRVGDYSRVVDLLRTGGGKSRRV